MFYEQHLRSQIPKAQKDNDDLNYFFALLGSAHVKASSKMLVKLTPDLKTLAWQLAEEKGQF